MWSIQRFFLNCDDGLLRKLFVNLRRPSEHQAWPTSSLANIKRGSAWQATRISVREFETTSLYGAQSPSFRSTLIPLVRPTLLAFGLVKLAASLTFVWTAMTTAPDSAALALTLADDGLGNITGAGTFGGRFPAVVSNLSALASGGSINGSFDYDDGSTQGSGSFSGTFTDSTIVLDSILTFDSVGDTCQGNYTGSIGRADVGAATPGDLVTNNAQLQFQVASFVGAIQGHLNNRFFGGGRGSIDVGANGFSLDNGGAASAGAFDRVGVWANYAFTDFDNDFAGAAIDGATHNIIAGVDFQPFDGGVLGIAIGVEISDVDTKFNGGELDKNGFTIAPYFAVQFNDNISFDISGGYSHLTIDQFRVTNNTQVISDTDSQRYFIAVNGNGVWTRGPFVIGARTGFMAARESVNGFRESDGTVTADRDVHFSQWSIGGDVGYSVGSWEPYVTASYQYDFAKDEYSAVNDGGVTEVVNDDNDDMLMGFGVRYFNDKGISANIEFTTRVAREHVEEHNFSGTLRYDF